MLVRCATYTVLLYVTIVYLYNIDNIFVADVGDTSKNPYTAGNYYYYYEL